MQSGQLDVLAVVQHIPPLKCHAQVEDHCSSAMGLLLNGIGFSMPYFSADPAAKNPSDCLEAFASSQGPLTLGGIILACTELLCNIWETRSSYIQGIPYGLANRRGMGIVGINPWTSTVEEKSIVSRTHAGISGHYGRAIIFELALADSQLSLAEMHDPGSVEVEAARNAIQSPSQLGPEQVSSYRSSA